MTITIGELILKAANASTEDEQIAVFQKHARDYGKDVPLLDALRILFDKSYKFHLPEGLPETKLVDLPDGCGDTNLRTEMRRMYIFFQKDVPQQRREVLFLQVFEGLASSDRKVLVMMKDQSLRSIKSTTINKIFPNLIQDPVDIEDSVGVVESVETNVVDNVEEAPEQPKPKKGRKKQQNSEQEVKE